MACLVPPLRKELSFYQSHYLQAQRLTLRYMLWMLLNNLLDFDEKQLLWLRSHMHEKDCDNTRIR